MALISNGVTRIPLVKTKNLHMSYQPTIHTTFFLKGKIHIYNRPPVTQLPPPPPSHLPVERRNGGRADGWKEAA